MSLRWMPAVGADCDRMQALTCRLQAVIRSEDLFRERLEELAQRWRQTEAEHGAARDAATAALAQLEDDLDARDRARAARMHTVDARRQATTVFYYRFYLWLRNFSARPAPAARLVALAAAEADMAAFDAETTALRSRAAVVRREWSGLQASFDDVAYARDRLNQDLAATVSERRQLEADIRTCAVSALVDRPVWALIQTAAAMDNVEVEHLFSLRRQLRPQMAAAAALDPVPPPLPPPDLAEAVQDGFLRRQFDGKGTVAVSGSGTTEVRRTRRYRDNDGNWRTESYTDTVSIHFDGSVPASFAVETQRWMPSPFSRAVANHTRHGLAAGRQRQNRAAQSTPQTQSATRTLLDLLDLRQVPE